MAQQHTTHGHRDLQTELQIGLGADSVKISDDISSEGRESKPTRLYLEYVN